MSGFVKLLSDARPDRTIRLSRDRVYWPPPGCIKSSETARRIGKTDAQLRAMRAREPGEDRGPAWVTAANGHHIAYTPQAVAAYVAERAGKLKAKADAMLARVADAETESAP